MNEDSQYVIRGIRADEWEKVKELRLAALADPVAPVAFLENPVEAAAQPDEFWQGRAEGGAKGNPVRQFVAEAADGRWVGSVTVLLESAGARGIFDEVIPVEQGHLVGVFVRPEQRGTGLTEALFQAALDWAWGLEEPVLERVRLFVHEENARAQAFYRRFGFAASGTVVPMPGDSGAKEFEYLISRP
ncbi:GNAT family N-acetyltransferase [Streptomyces sp. NBC_00536]|uniref:GNAT family N-acetyltransferase n=1 Tax=Streptomyces sp. NBC_00536 TaxID=2975769 RepID=UPI002E81784C|nr:GNAT family N-acetyltransferase [Streptomyces sp. NBC_00536]WUC80307.1 GNAT family N-acetyltransferase [Streptomyces sp. NBC_00536]